MTCVVAEPYPVAVSSVEAPHECGLEAHRRVEEAGDFVLLGDDGLDGAVGVPGTLEPVEEPAKGIAAEAVATKPDMDEKFRDEYAFFLGFEEEGSDRSLSLHYRVTSDVGFSDCKTVVFFIPGVRGPQVAEVGVRIGPGTAFSIDEVGHVAKIDGLNSEFHHEHSPKRITPVSLMEKTLTVREAATLLRCSLSQVYQLVVEEELAGFRLASKILIFEKSIDEYVLRHSFGGKKEGVANPPPLPRTRKKSPKPRRSPPGRLSSPFPFR